MMGGWGWSMGLVGGLAMLLFWALFIGLLVWLVIILTRTTQSQPPRNHMTTDPSALEILRRRLAAGEITPQEFDELRHKLGI